MLGAIKVAREFWSVVTGRIRQRKTEREGGREWPRGTSWHNRNFKVSLVLKSEENSATAQPPPFISARTTPSLLHRLSPSLRFPLRFPTVQQHLSSKLNRDANSGGEKNCGKLYRRLNDGTSRRLTSGKIRLVPTPPWFLPSFLETVLP